MAEPPPDAQPAPEPPKAVRSAEKDRVATCAFADRVASCVLAAYRREGGMFDAERREARRQTVVAGICVLDTSCEPASLECVAWGCGTKFLRPEAVEADVTGELVRDSHAEVLARRAFVHLLYAELEAALGVAAPAAEQLACTAGGARPRLLEPVGPSSDPPHAWRLRAGVSLHMYSSSQPCGNASVKRWAKGAAERPFTQLGADAWPRELAQHARQFWPQRAQGQLARLLKKPPAEPRAPAAAPAACGVPTDVKAGAPTVGAPAGAEGNIVHAPGTAPVGTAGSGRTHTCSDKLCRWQCLGLQGGLLSHLLPEPCTLETLTVGRKFHRACLERAVCCRAQDFAPPAAPGADGAVGGPAGGSASKRRRRAGPRLLPPAGSAYRVAHVAALCTAVKLDPDTAICTEQHNAQHACFDDPRALWWSAACTHAEVLDALTGLPITDAVERAIGSQPRPSLPGRTSAICSRALHARFRSLCDHAGRDDLLELDAVGAKRASTTYADARHALLTDWQHLGGWQLKSPTPTKWQLGDVVQDNANGAGGVADAASSCRQSS